MKTLNVRRNQLMVPMLLASALLAGCASEPKPDAELALSRSSVDAAVAAGSAEAAPVELKTAQDKLDAAQRALAAEEYDKARRLAEEATADAKLATSMSEAAEAQNNLREAQKSHGALQQEAGRPTAP